MELPPAVTARRQYRCNRRTELRLTIGDDTSLWKIGAHNISEQFLFYDTRVEGAELSMIPHLLAGGGMRIL